MLHLLRVRIMMAVAMIGLLMPVASYATQYCCGSCSTCSVECSGGGGCACTEGVCACVCVGTLPGPKEPGAPRAVSESMVVTVTSMSIQDVLVLTANKAWNWNLDIDTSLDLSASMTADLGSQSLSGLLDALGALHGFCWTANDETDTISIDPCS